MINKINNNNVLNVFEQNGTKKLYCVVLCNI